MNKTIFSFIGLFLVATISNSQAQAGYQVAPDSKGQLKCHDVIDAQLFLTEDIFCTSGYRAANSSRGAQCFAMDAQGTTFGNSVTDAYCSSGYRAAETSAGSFCFNVDVLGKIYGRPVNDIYCQDSYQSISTGKGVQKCFNVDAFGKAYGQPVEDFYCN